MIAHYQKLAMQKNVPLKPVSQMSPLECSLTSKLLL